ncbi:hypothetical protein NC651_030497 [Populus alba x Populus x berolinensis]|nr:hypothetical protein NC651_030497 [Populus alba x Populus x berolinensis]
MAFRFKRLSGVWCGMTFLLQPVDPCFHTIRSSIRHVVGNDSSIHFSTDVWVGLVTLQNAFPRLFLVSSSWDATVAGSGQRIQAN